MSRPSSISFGSTFAPASPRPTCTWIMRRACPSTGKSTPPSTTQSRIGMSIALANACERTSPTRWGGWDLRERSRTRFVGPRSAFAPSVNGRQGLTLSRRGRSLGCGAGVGLPRPRQWRSRAVAGPLKSFAGRWMRRVRLGSCADCARSNQDASDWAASSSDPMMGELGGSSRREARNRKEHQPSKRSQGQKSA